MPGDLDGHGDVDLFDFTNFFMECSTGHGGGPVPSQCQGAEADNDGDVDLLDFGAFQIAFSAP